ncbi:MAG: altronate dehydratase large subunit [Clostridia bacterium]|jgi:altronate dehydratase large subunit|nr:altronate dehydratase large subunit [Clostridia bacterium]
MDKIMGYMRPNGKIGIRNHVLIIPSVGCAAHVSDSISREVPGSIYLDNQYGCGQIGKDLKQSFRTLAGLGSNPNVAAVLVVGLGCEALRPEELVMEIAKSGKPVEMLLIQESGGTTKTIKKGVQIARNMVEEASKIKSELYSIENIVLGLECGGSDTTSGLAANPALGYAADLLIKQGGKVILSETPEMIGAEHILAKRAISSTIADKLLKVVKAFEQKAIDEGENIRETQPSPGNKAGGLTTIEEKSLGCVYKAGTSNINDVVDYAEPIKEKGLTVMNTPGQDVQSMIGMLAGGAQIIAFTTGRGNPCGTPIAPVIKITGNLQTYKKMKENFDVYVGDLIESDSSMEIEGLKIYNKILDACNGKETISEKLGHREFAMWRIGTTY